MKKVLLIIASFSMLFADTMDIKKIVQKIETVKNFKIPDGVPYKVYDPFESAKPILKRSSHPSYHHVKRGAIVIETILNHRAFIRGAWYKRGDFIYGAKILQVSQHGVVVEKGSVKRFIPLKKGKNFIKIKEYIQ